MKRQLKAQRPQILRVNNVYHGKGISIKLKRCGRYYITEIKKEQTSRRYFERHCSHIRKEIYVKPN